MPKFELTPNIMMVDDLVLFDKAHSAIPGHVTC